MTADTWLRTTWSCLVWALRTVGEVCLRAAVPAAVVAHRTNAHVQDLDAPKAKSSWEQRVAADDMPPANALRHVLQAQAERMRGSEAKAVGSLQLTALLLAGWIFAASEATTWAIKVPLVVAASYLASSVWSALQVLRPSLRHVLGPTSCSDTPNDRIKAAMAYEQNIPMETRRANLVTAALLDAVRGAAVIGVAAVGSLLI